MTCDLLVTRSILYVSPPAVGVSVQWQMCCLEPGVWQSCRLWQRRRWGRHVWWVDVINGSNTGRNATCILLSFCCMLHDYLNSTFHDCVWLVRAHSKTAWLVRAHSMTVCDWSAYIVLQKHMFTDNCENHHNNTAMIIVCCAVISSLAWLKFVYIVDQHMLPDSAWCILQNICCHDSIFKSVQ